MQDKTDANRRKKAKPETETWKCETLTDRRRIFYSEWNKFNEACSFQWEFNEAQFVEYCENKGFERAFTKRPDGSFVVVLTPKEKKQLAINF
jgi:hypothetical protein